MILYGYERHGTVLGVKTEQCTTCHVTGPHQLVRKVWWASLFTIPLVPLWFRHGMACTACGAWTGIRWGTMRKALRDRSLPFPERKRTDVWEIRQAAADERGMIPNEAEVFDPVIVNPKRGGADVAFRLWPIAALLIVGLFGASQVLGPKPTPTPGKPTAHTCYTTDNVLNGCRYSDGTMEGEAIGTEVTCYFAEPLPTPDWRVYCP